MNITRRDLLAGGVAAGLTVAAGGKADSTANVHDASLGQRIVGDAATALGGRERIQAVKTLVIEGQATTWNLGQDLSIDAVGQTFTMNPYRRIMDLALGRDRIEQTQTPNFTYFAGQAPVKLVNGLDGTIAYDVAANGNARRASEALAHDRRLAMLYHPLTILRAALDPAAAHSNARTSGGQQLVDVRTAGGLSVTLAIDTSTKLPSRVIAMAETAGAPPGWNLGDVTIETSFADYRNVNGLKLPMRLTTKAERWKTAEVRVTDYTLNAVTSDLIAPVAASSAVAFAEVPPIAVPVTEYGKGIWILGQSNYNVVLVEFADHLILIEGLQNETGTLAFIAKARELRPGKPLTAVVNTHYHFDHSGGLRAAVSEGLTIITAKENARYYRDVVARKHTIAPDALVRNPKPLKLQTVNDALVLKDASMTVEIYRFPVPLHVDAMLMAYIPGERLLIEADVYASNGTLEPFSPSLVEAVTRLNLAVDKVAPIHGPVVPYSVVVKAAQAA